MLRNNNLVARPAGVYVPSPSKGLVWRTCLERQTQILAPCETLANPYGPEADGHPLPALTITQGNCAMAVCNIIPMRPARKLPSQVGEPTFNVSLVKRPLKRPVVYFVQAENGLIKIGSTKYIASRFQSLCTGSPLALVLLATIKGDRAREFELHAKFAAHRQHGEWFLPHPEIVAEIARVTARRKRPAHPDQRGAGV